MTGRPVDRRVIAVAIGAPLLAVALVVGLSVSAGDGDDSAVTTTVPVSAPPASTRPVAIDDRWNEALAAALEPLNDVLVRLASGVDAWSTGERSDEDLDQLLTEMAPRLRGVRDQVAELDQHRSEPIAQPLVRHMADLYVLSVDAHELALAADDADITRQYDLLGRRLRILADRVFDRARERTNAPIDLPAEIRLVLPAEVPDWSRLELAPGPPLEPADPNRPDALPLEREEERKTQDEEDWQADVEALDAPTSDEVRVGFGDRDRLGAAARRLVEAAEALRSVPVPDEDRGRADRLALGWLIRADGARAAQLATFGDDGDRRIDLAEGLLAVSGADVLSPS